MSDLPAEPADALDPADQVGKELGLDPLQLRVGGSLGQEAGQLLVDRLFHHGQVHTRLGRGLDLEQAADLATAHAGPDATRDLLVVDQPFVEPRGLA